MFGDIIKVTPTSKVVGDMAITMVTSGLTREAVLDPAVEIAFPDSVVHLFHGELGQPVGGFPAELQKKVLGGKAAAHGAPGRIAAAGGPRGGAQAAEAKVGRTISENELASYLCTRRYSPTTRPIAPRSATSARCRPPCSFTEWTRAGDQHRSRARQDPDRALRDHQRSARGRHAHGFFRTQRPAAPDSRRGSQPGGEAPAAAQSGAGQRGPCGRPHARHASPRCRCTWDKSLNKGEVLLTLEAMKMETTVRAERDGMIKEILARPGLQVDTKDLLIVFDSRGSGARKRRLRSTLPLPERSPAARRDPP